MENTVGQSIYEKCLAEDAKDPGTDTYNRVSMPLTKDETASLREYLEFLEMSPSEPWEEDGLWFVSWTDDFNGVEDEDADA